MLAENSIDKIKKRARSQSMVKWIGVMEDELDMSSFGDTPTERMKDLIEKIKSKIDVNGLGEEFSEDFDELVRSSFFNGAQRGFGRALKRFQDGSITARKKKNKDYWVLYSHSKQYQITADLPTVDGGTQRATVYLKLEDHGFE